MRIKCPNCGSSAQIRLIEKKYSENGCTIEAVRIYACGCGCRFKNVSYYHCEDACEDTTILSMTYPSKLAGEMIKAIISKNEKKF